MLCRAVSVLATFVSIQTVVFFEDRLLGRLRVRLSGQQLLEPLQFRFQLLDPCGLLLQLVCELPIFLGQLPNPFLLVVTGVHARNLLDRPQITKPSLSENRQLPRM